MKGQNTKQQPDNASSVALSRMDALVKRRDEINERVADIENEYGVIFSKRHQLQTAVFNLQDRLRGMPENEKHYAEARRELSAELEQLRLDFTLNEEHHKKLEEEIKQLQTIELPACMVAVCAEDVHEHFQRITLAKTEVDSIRTAIDAQHHVVAEAKATIPGVVDRQHERHNIMADIALGKETEDALKNLDAEIYKDQKAIAAAEKNATPKIENALNTVSGLARKLAAAQEFLNTLKSKSAEIARRYYVGEIEKAAVQYVNHALQLKVLYTRLAGLDIVIKKYDAAGIVNNLSAPISIPTFRTPQFEGLADPHIRAQSLFHADQILGEKLYKAAEVEESKFDAILKGYAC